VALRFSGLHRTDPGYLRRFLRSTPGGPADSALARADAVRLRRLDPVADVTVRWRDTVGGRVLVFAVQEAWTLYPILGFGGVRGNVWGQVGATELHAGGRGVVLAADARWTDGRPGGQLRVRVPHLAGGAWGLEASATRLASREPFFFSEQTVQYRYTNHTVEALALRELSPGHGLEAGAALLHEDYRLDEDLPPGSAPGPERLRLTKGLAKLRWRLDRTDRRHFWRHGWLFDGLATHVYTPGAPGFTLALVDAHAYRRTGRAGNLAARLRLGASTNTPSPFAPFVLDSRVNLRGAGNRVDRGTATVVLNAEYRHAVFEGPRFAAQLVGFADAGSWRSPGGDWSDLASPERFRQFLGGGARLIWKRGVDAQLRVDYGVNPLDPSERGFVVGLGPYF
jgi:outer membrane protein assembly factor BamA